MKAEVAGATADQRLLDILATLLRQGALPGELDNYSAEETREAAAFIAACAARREPGKALVRLESTGTGLGHRIYRGDKSFGFWEIEAGKLLDGDQIVEVVPRERL